MGVGDDVADAAGDATGEIGVGDVEAGDGAGAVDADLELDVRAGGHALLGLGADAALEAALEPAMIEAAGELGLAREAGGVHRRRPRPGVGEDDRADRLTVEHDPAAGAEATLRALGLDEVAAGGLAHPDRAGADHLAVDADRAAARRDQRQRRGGGEHGGGVGPQPERAGSRGGQRGQLDVVEGPDPVAEQQVAIGHGQALPGADLDGGTASGDRDPAVLARDRQRAAGVIDLERGAANLDGVIAGDDQEALTGRAVLELDIDAAIDRERDHRGVEALHHQARARAQRRRRRRAELERDPAVAGREVIAGDHELPADLIGRRDGAVGAGDVALDQRDQRGQRARRGDRYAVDDTLGGHRRRRRDHGLPRGGGDQRRSAITPRREPRHRARGGEPDAGQRQPRPARAIQIRNPDGAVGALLAQRPVHLGPDAVPAQLRRRRAGHLRERGPRLPDAVPCLPAPLAVVEVDPQARGAAAVDATGGEVGEVVRGDVAHGAPPKSSPSSAAAGATAASAPGGTPPPSVARMRYSSRRA